MTTAEILAAIETLKHDPLAGEDQFLRLYDLLDMTDEERAEALADEDDDFQTIDDYGPDHDDN